MDTIKDLFELLNEKYPEPIDRNILYKHYGVGLINSLRTNGMLEYHTKNGKTYLRLTSMGFGFLVQTKINKNIEEMNKNIRRTNDSVEKLTKSSGKLENLTKLLVILTTVLIIFTFILIILGAITVF